ncbi:hypothetical protein AMIS_72490 [Actinoplanes missouriensis 431]|uniref:Uncharacterized protein n=1 Tax=Actinoplanes missouriensis (strain ATCC 14538 / DSM 43046 / CBS 188.64 / JCM 3121 / NBRC 102363 / NCIMB 12654 / NRRL B-3342 / UNCC 431) TaxID=512565 RepID=I0HHI2_ACTM4|nr:hypothetical protein [Actinoplanes missouriensis]BAL92469.1 hypothetical protein AMIS_72490 [Actinoplanes missouriensis 431]
MSASPLERRYRRLLRVYPAGHRAAYEEEMVGVLMSGAAPGRRFPSPADAVDLLGAGLTARLGWSARALRGPGWRDAATLTGFALALMLATDAIDAFVDGLRAWLSTGGGTDGWPAMSAGRGLGVSGGDGLGAGGGLLIAEPGIRALAWSAVAVAAVAGLRRVTAVLAGVAALAQIGTIAFWAGVAPWQSVRLTWTPAVAVLVFGAFLAAAPGRPPLRVLGRSGSWLAGAAVVAVLGWTLVLADLSIPLPAPLSAEMFDFWLPLGLGAAAVTCAPRGVRSRCAALFAAVVVGPLTMLAWWDALVLDEATAGVAPGRVTAGALALTLVPLAALTLGVVGGWGRAGRFGEWGRG